MKVRIRTNLNDSRAKENVLTMSQASAVVAYSIGGFVSEKKPKDKLLDLFAPELFSAQSREELMEGLRARAERFYQEASIEEIIELTRLVESLLKARGLLRKQGPRQIH